MIFFVIYQDEAIQKIYEYKQFIEENILLSIFILAIAEIIASILFIPSSIFAIICGFIFATFMKENKILGYILSLLTFLTIQGVAGCVVFNLSIYFFGKKIRQELILKSTKLVKIDKVLNLYGHKALFLFRLSPLVPVSLLNYILGGFNSNHILIFSNNKSLLHFFLWFFSWRTVLYLLRLYCFRRK